MRNITILLIMNLLACMPCMGFDLPNELFQELGSVYMGNSRNPAMAIDMYGNLHILYSGEYRKYNEYGDIIEAGNKCRYLQYSHIANTQIMWHDIDMVSNYGAEMKVSADGYAYCIYGHDKYYMQVFHNGSLLYAKYLGYLPFQENSFLLPDNSYVIPYDDREYIAKSERALTIFDSIGNISYYGSIKDWKRQLRQLPFGIGLNPTIIALNADTVIYVGYSQSNNPDSLNSRGAYNRHDRIGVIMYNWRENKVINYRDFKLSAISSIGRNNIVSGLNAIPVPDGKIYIFFEPGEDGNNYKSSVFVINRDLEITSDRDLNINELETKLPLDDKSIENQFCVFDNDCDIPDCSGYFIRYVIANKKIYYSKSDPIICEICIENRRQRENFQNSMKIYSPGK